MDEVIAAHVDANHIQLPLMASVGPSSHKNGGTDKIAVKLKPLRDELFKVVHFSIIAV
jgi:hypothetical protein